MAVGSAPAGKQVPVLTLEGDAVVLRFPFRKNRLWPSQLKRACWCKQCALTCPVHVLGCFMSSLPTGTQPFIHMCPAQVLLALRELLCEIRVPNAWHFRTHDFRRGHAEDLRRNGARLSEILTAGDWRSAAFATYLDSAQLEQDRVAEAHVACFSDSDPESAEEGHCTAEL